ncbi:MAG: hypothetical protein VYC39_02665 [Myxococcota bacterium]|nr:hypothetical protein [Myxococcota bacterium]
MKADRSNTSGISPVQTNMDTATAAPANQAPSRAPGAPEKPEGYVTGSSSSTQALRSTGLSPVTVRMNAETTTPTNKPFRFSKHSGPEIRFPLTPSQAAKLANSNAVSPFLESDQRVVVRPNFLPLPTHPGDPGFWKEFEDIVDFQIARRNGDLAAESMDLPKIFNGYDMDEASQAVRADFPSKWPTALTEQLLAEGAKIDRSIIPGKTNAEFVDGPVLLARIIGWAVSEVSPSAFACKWSQGRARPESVAWAVKNGELDAPAHIKAKIDEMNLARPEDFTAYEEGSPRHPSWPAMHSAASCASLYLGVLLDLTPEQLEETKKVDWAVAKFRSFAGVHYDTDNRAGLALGQEVIAQELPEVLKRFGADPDAVRAKIEKVRHDWYKYDTETKPNL